MILKRGQTEGSHFVAAPRGQNIRPSYGTKAEIAKGPSRTGGKQKWTTAAQDHRNTDGGTTGPSVAKSTFTGEVDDATAFRVVGFIGHQPRVETQDSSSRVSTLGWYAQPRWGKENRTAKAKAETLKR